MVARRQLTGGGNYFSAPKTHREFISSGSKLLDLVLGGGWAERRVGNIIGDASSGKTLLTIEAGANFARKYPKGKFFHRECETAFDFPYAEVVGMPTQIVDSANLNTVEDFFDDINQIVKTRTKQPLFYVLDSLDAISSRAELARKIDEGSYGTERAKQLSQMFRRRIPAALDKANITLLIVSQTRDKVGALIGAKWTVAGGNALKFYASQRLLLDQLKRLMKTVKGVKRAEGILVKAQCIKNKIGLPFRDCEFAIKFAYGIDDIAECLDFLAAVDGLKDIGCTKTGRGKYLREMRKLGKKEFNASVEAIHAVTEKHWYEVEKGFAPRWRKYA